MKVIEATGSAYEIGLAHGREGREQVIRSIETYRNMFMTYANLSWEEAKLRSIYYVEPIKAFDSDLMEELQGVADGAGVSLEDILALNARSEVIMMSGSVVMSDGCTSLAVLPEASADGRTWLAQNWDWKGTQLEAVLVLKIKQVNKPEVTMVTEGGIIGKIGFNSAGIGVCLNALGTIGNPQGLPLHIILRGILNSSKLSDALQRINCMQNACAANYLIASACGEAMDVEKAPTDFDVLYPQDGIIVHTNHFVSAKIKVEDLSRLLVPDTFLRYGRADKLIRCKHGSITPDYIKEIFSDHADYPDSICRHKDPLDPINMQMCTVFSVIMNLTDRKMQLVIGNPCSGEFEYI